MHHSVLLDNKCHLNVSALVEIHQTLQCSCSFTMPSPTSNKIDRFYRVYID